MSMINDYLSKLKKQYPNTQAVQEQLEELRDTLHIKTEEYQSQGLNYNAAVKAAIDSLGDVTPLLEEVSGNVKNVYVNKLNRNNALFCTLIILAEFMMGWLGYSLFTGNHVPFGYFSVTLLILLISVCIWPVITIIQYKKEPDRVSTVEMPFKKLIKTAIIGWLCISFFLFCVNFIVNDTVWFQWPVIGIFTWPLNIVLYHRQLMSGRYDAA